MAHGFQQHEIMLASTEFLILWSAVEVGDLDGCVSGDTNHLKVGDVLNTVQCEGATSRE